MAVGKPTLLQRMLRPLIRRTLSSELNWLLGLTGGSESYTGVTVTEITALQSSAVFACVRNIAETIASLPLFVYKRRDDGGKDRWPAHSLYSILHNKPNPEMTSFEFREIMLAHILLWGNSYCELVYNGAGRIMEIWPLRPDRMNVERKDKKLKYTYTLPDKKEVVISNELVWHTKGFGYDGITGLSVIGLARESIGLSLATEEYGARYFGSGATPDGVLTHPGKLTPVAIDSMKKSWDDQHKGLSKSHRVAILQEGVSYTQIGIPPEDSQFLETRKFQIRDICRIFRMQPHKIADLEDATFSNVEEENIDHVVDTIRPWCVRFEQSTDMRLFPPEEQAIFFVEFLIDGLLRGNIVNRYSAYATARQNGWMCADDIRELENMNPIPDDKGKVYLIPLNMIPAPGPDTKTQEPVKKPETKSIESRSRLRQKTIESYRELFKDTASRIIRRERNDVMAAAKKFLSRRDNMQFNSWLVDFYEEHKEFIKTNMKPIFHTYGKLISTGAADEINFKNDISVELSDFMEKYTDIYSIRHSADSTREIRQVVSQPGDDIEELEAMFEDWDKNRAEKIAKNETVQMAGAVTKFTFIAGGITKLVWMASANACPICQELDGVIIGIEGAFTDSGNISHAPLHDGCECDIGPA